MVESKGSMFPGAIRRTEKAKIDCGKEHFDALDTGVEFTNADSFQNFMGQVVKWGLRTPPCSASGKGSV